MVRSGLWPAASAAVLAAVLSLASPALAAPDKAPAASAGAIRQDGLLPVYVDKAKGRILLSLPAPDADGVSGRYLYVTALRTGLGSALVGLDRARLGDTQILAFRRIGKKVVAEFENHRFRAQGAPADEQAAARDAFAVSTVWAGDVLETAPDGRILVDIASFLTRLSARQVQLGGLEGRVHLPMTRLDIADYLGLTIETVSRVFTQFKTSGLIQLLPNNEVALPDPETLKALGDGAS